MSSGPAPQRRIGAAETAGLLLLSAATLTFETILFRLFSVAQFYHFAFMIVSTALLGFGFDTDQFRFHRFDGVARDQHHADDEHSDSEFHVNP